MILRKAVAGLSEAALERFVSRAKHAVKLEGTVNILVTTNPESRLLNSRFRGKDKPTDVLSFPPSIGMVADFAGDMAISASIAAENARRLGHSVADEVRILVLHGLMHLAGYDHDRDQGEMVRTEELLRKKLGLPAGLIARNAESFRRRAWAVDDGKMAPGSRRKNRTKGSDRAFPERSRSGAHATRAKSRRDR